MTYTLRDILHLLQACPDKAVTRASHMAHKNGDRFALQLLKDLRGELMETQTSQPHIWAVASRDANNMVVALWNDSREVQTVPLCVAPPVGWSFAGVTKREAVRKDETIEINEVASDADWKNGASLVLGARRSAVLKFVLVPNPASVATTRVTPMRVAQTQFYAASILQKVSSDATQTLPVALPAVALRKATAARLRFVIEGNTQGFSLRFNDRVVPFQISDSYLNEVEIPTSWLREQNQITFGCDTGSEEFQIDTASLLLSALEPDTSSKK